MSPALPAIVPVIMSGGSGTRLWPLSTDETPKQFHALGSARTMIQETALRFVEDEDASGSGMFLPPVLISNARHRTLIETQLAQAGIKPACVVLEPFGRNTAAVAAIAARVVQDLHPGALALLLPADHVIRDVAAFRDAIAAGARAAATHIVTFGIEPDGPETGYGYIQAGAPLMEGVFAVARFVEKPKREVAQAWLDEGGYYWNGGIFLFSPAVMLAELAAARPDIHDAALAALEGSPINDGVVVLDDALFAAVPAQSIDVAVMEKTRLAAVAPADVGWADVGSWSELWRLGPTDSDGNMVVGEALLHDVSSSLVWSDGSVTLAVIGMEDVVVVVSGGAVAVLPKSRAQDVKTIVGRLKAAR